MQYALVIAGGSGTRLWPMSRQRLPKQLIPFLDGKSLLQAALERLDGLIPAQRQLICAGQAHRERILASVRGMTEERFYGEPEGRDTLNAIALVVAHVAQRDAEAVVGVFTADHVIGPVDQFRRIVAAGFEVAQRQPGSLVTFGIAPTHAATAYGYLELGPAAAQAGASAQVEGRPPHRVLRFKEKPDADTAARYLSAGPQRYLWNSGMFVWRAGVFLDALARFAPANHQPIMELAQVWDTPRRAAALARLYPTLPKISVDYAIMEPAARDPGLQVVALPMPLSWLDVGSWPSLAQVCQKDQHGNAVSPANLPHVLLESQGNLLASSDPEHLVTAIGCENLIIIHTPDATLVCRADRAEDIKKLHALVGQRLGPERL